MMNERRNRVLAWTAAIGLAVVFTLAGCHKDGDAGQAEPTPEETSTRHADARLDADMARLSGAAQDTADSAQAVGKELVAKGKGAAADAVDDVSVKASQAAKKLRQ
ncbi:hypothetical protein Y88_3263 [Novosphingobium nitrogenifigens DSM 19370]|uniref:Lipoprotein n=1 Tax=Novosphingobium nitrogenifigens DSM 19370 TaxID=983920 RepID=F1ZBZ1_9SPHN|nr:hypothetical protein [Novosphingobium nitrogenifigens]EGD57933.1 hypothetical protein Y88_3263 [Novosphingobium nitrogenifigens DSM 19370]